MATQGSQDVKIFSSVRPLQIQRSFEGSTEGSDTGLIKQDVSVQRSSTVTITSQSSTMSINQPGTGESIKISSLPIDPGTVTFQTISPVSPASPTSPGTVLIRSSAAKASPVPIIQTGKQNVMIIRSPTAVVPSSPAPGQSTVVIKSSSTQQVTQSAAQSKIVINPAPLVQNRIIVSPSSASPAPTQNEPEVVTNGPQVQIVQARRSSLTIKTAPNPESISVASPVTCTPASEQIQSAAPVYEGSPTITPVTPPEHFTPVTPPEHFTPEINEPKPSVTEHRHQDALTPATSKEKVPEKEKPAGPSVLEILEKFNISSAFLVAFAVLITVVACIVTEGEVPLSWILAAISAISLVSFVALRL